MKYNCIGIFVLFISVIAVAQPNYTANDIIPSYEGNTFFGTNMGFYEGWQDEQLADIAIGNPDLSIEGLGVQTLRPTLPEHFLNFFGYDIRIKAFEHYKSLGLKDHTCFLQEPTPEHRETFRYCDNEPSLLFANMYLDIWDNGENETPVNDANFYALYVYKTVTMYKDYIKFWEIWNEPDFSFTSNSTESPGSEGNWWENNPDPCQYKLKAPIFHYIRTLRISYEVIKSIDPDAYITVGGLGYPSFLDAILRNTDNPEDGSVDDKYPLGGGAYFDVLSYHSYPHIDNSLREWSNAIQGFVYKRHSDEAVKGVIDLKDEFETTLYKYGYNGNQYPEKEWIITEVNIPRVKFGEFIGSDAAQRNFMIKSIVECKKENILQFHVFNLGEANSLETEFNEFDFMGLYKPLAEAGLYNQTKTDGGIAYHTASILLGNTTYDPVATEEMNLPFSIRGGAFRGEDGLHTYVLWSATTEDESEISTAEYSFPEDWDLNFIETHGWDYSVTGLSDIVSTENVELSASPIFLKATSAGFVGIPRFNVGIYPNPFKDSIVINYDVQHRTAVTIEILDISGKLMAKIIEKELHAEGSFQQRYNGSDLPRGVYLCRMTTTNDILVAKIMKN